MVNKMTSILFRAPALSLSGYGVHARQIARWLFENAEKYKLDISTELLNWGQTPWITDIYSHDGLIGELVQASNNPKPFYDLTVQLQLPNEWNPMAGTYNIGVTAGIEADRCQPAWIDCINKMSLVIVPSEFTKKCFIDTAIANNKKLITDIIVIPESFPDILLKEQLPELPLDLKTDFNFLVFGQLTGNNPENDRKNIFYTFKWFSETFAGNPDVGIIFKTNAGRLTKLDRAVVKNLFHRLLFETKVNPIGPKFYLLHGDMTEEEVGSLYRHPKIKTFLTLTHGEGFCGLDYTPVITNKGIKRLDSVNIGEKVLTHMGNWKSVTQTLSRDYNGNMIKIIPYNSFIEPIILTPNHHVYTFDSKTKSYYWKPCGEISKDDLLCLPIPKRNRELEFINIINFITNKNNLEINEKNYISYKHSNNQEKLIQNTIKLDKNFGRLIGYYFAEGCSGNGTITFSLHKNEKATIAKDIIQLMQQIFKLENFSIQEFEDNNNLLLKFNNEILCNFFESICGKGAKNKVLNHTLATEANHLFTEGFLTGVFLGNGYLSEKEISLELGSIEGIRQIRTLLLEKKIICSSNSQKKIGEIKETQYNNDYYRLKISNIDSYNLIAQIFFDHSPIIKLPFKMDTCKNQGKTKFFIHDDNIIFKIKSIENHEYNGKVYNLSVQDDESYCTENFVVHNCLPALEAAASGLPVIATDWSAHTEFLNHGRFVKIEAAVEPIHDNRVDNLFPKGAKWAYPKETDVKMRLTKFFMNPETSKQWADELKNKIKENYSYTAISKYYDNLFERVLKECL